LPKDSEDMSFVLNLDTAKKIGISVPQAVVDKAKVIISDGQVTRK
jgi:ABC-type uncharacterized transport system substrate-binding protein